MRVRSRKVRDSGTGESVRENGGLDEFGGGRMGGEEEVIVIWERGQLMRDAR